jgi:hypothetical protein
VVTRCYIIEKHLSRFVEDRIRNSTYLGSMWRATMLGEGSCSGAVDLATGLSGQPGVNFYANSGKTKERYLCMQQRLADIAQEWGFKERRFHVDTARLMARRLRRTQAGRRRAQVGPDFPGGGERAIDVSRFNLKALAPTI